VSLYGPVFTAIYDPLLAWGERAGMRDLRRDVLAAATGDVLELGAGTGLNVDAYPPTVASLTLTEPEPSMARRLEGLRGGPRVVQAGAERLPFEDDAFDTVVSTLVLCTVEDPDLALREVRRVLRPGGALLLIEHVRSSRPRLAALQDRLHRPWRAIGYGCNCNRDTAATLRRAGFATTALRPARWRRMPSIVRPLIAGPAEPAG
jgi:SAM-dependent methyltransferase